VIPLLHWTGHLTFPALLAASFAVGCFTAPYFSSSRLVIPEVVGEDERLVAAANAVLGGANQLTQIAGPVLAGVLIAASSPSTVLVVDGATYVFSFLTILAAVRAGRRVEESAESRGLLAGLRFLLRDPLLGPSLLVACVLNLVVQALIVGIDVLAYFEYANAHAAGILFGGFGAGAFLGAVVAQQVVQRVDLLKLVAVAIVAMPLPLWLLAISLPWLAATVVVAGFGFFTPLVNAPILAVMTTRTPPALRPKVMTAVMTVATLASPLGFVGGSQALHVVSLRLLFVLTAALLTLCGLLFAAVILRNREAPAAGSSFAAAA
jgi:predicted MFS family arabinose efflux permease